MNEFETSVVGNSCIRSTLGYIPKTAKLCKQLKAPLSLVITPNQSFQSVELGSDIIRCRSCRAYINPYIKIVQNKWMCNVCLVYNDLPQSFYYDINTGNKISLDNRKEISCEVVDYLAPQEYMNRPPMCLSIIFVVDASVGNVRNLGLYSISNSLMKYIELIPNLDKRIKVGFVFVDGSINIIKFTNNSAYEIITMGELDCPFVPAQDGLCVNLSDNLNTIKTMLKNVPNMFMSSLNNNNALGSALDLVYQVISGYGGKITIFQASLPSIGLGILKNRDDAKLYGTEKESYLLHPQNPYYKEFAVKCSTVQISVDLFVLSNSYIDVSTLSCLSRYTGGHFYYYKNYNNKSDNYKLDNEVESYLKQEIGLEAVLRTRTNNSIRATTYYGNMFLRSTDLLSLPSVNLDHSYTVELVVEDTIETPFVSFQTALLYTSCYGERKIRVITIQLPVSDNINTIMSSVDQNAFATVIAKKACDRCLSGKLEDVREAINNKCIDIINDSKRLNKTNNISILYNMQHFVLIMLGLLKHESCKNGSVNSDIEARMFAINNINTMSIESVIPYLLPHLYPLHIINPNTSIDENLECIFQNRLNLKSDVINSDGIYLLYNTQFFIFYVCAHSNKELINNIFYTESYNTLSQGKAMLKEEDNNVSIVVNQLIKALILKTKNYVYCPEMFVVKEDGDPILRQMFFGYFVEDRNVDKSYHQFILMLKSLNNT